MKYQMVIAIVLVLTGFTGIVSADPCPGPSDTKWNGVPIVTAGLTISAGSTSGSGTGPYDYIVQAMPAFAGSPPIGFQELCIRTGNTVTQIAQTFAAPNWGSEANPNVFGFARLNGESNNIPFDGNVHDVGTITFSGNPGSQDILVHINDPAECRPTDQSDTCFRSPGTGGQPVPELNPMILTTTGLFGLVLLSRRCKKT